MSTTPTIILFDIDGTLLTSGGAGRRAIERAFGQTHGRTDACTDVAMAGMTDRAIVRQGLQAIGAEAAIEAIDAVLAMYLEVLAVEIAASMACRLHPGVIATLDSLVGRDGIAIGLGTGNVERGARIKLGRVGIADRFAFGGFGCDDEDRARLLAVGAARGAGQLGMALADCRIVVVGDTPRDVLAARAIGAVSVAVATGPYGMAELATAGADHVFRDLGTPGSLAALLATL